MWHNIRKIGNGQGGDYKSGCLLDFTYFKKYFKVIPIDFSRQQALDAYPKTVKQLNFTGNLEETPAMQNDP